MKIPAPQLPATLSVLEGLLEQMQQDETLSAVVVRNEDVAGAGVKGFTASELRLEKVNFTQAKLEKTSLIDVEFAGCDLIATALPEASWRRVAVKSSRCSGVQLQTSELKDITFSGCKLNLANFRFSRLTNVLFKDCSLDEADFYMAELRDVVFQNCTLEKTEFSSAKLRYVDLRTSDVFGVSGIAGLAGAIIDSAQLAGLAPQLAHELKIIVKDD